MIHGSDVPQPRRFKKTACFVLITMVGCPSTLFAQQPVAVPVPVPAPRFTSSAAAAVAGEEPDARRIHLLTGRSMLVSTGAPIVRVSLTSPDVADALVTAPAQLLVHGKVPGTISMFVWERTGAIRRYELTVERDLLRLNEQIKEMFPNESITVDSNGKNVILSGKVATKEMAERAGNLAAGFVEAKTNVVNLLEFQAARSNQVMLRVRFAEVSRSAMTELGASFIANGVDNGRWFGRSTTQQFAAPHSDDGKLVFSDFLNLFLFDSAKQISTVIRALQGKGLFQSLAEPNLVAESGKEASFLAGGEIPIPIAQGSGSNLAISVQFKEFGIRLNFTPEVVGDRIRLKVRPEVSSLDFSNAIELQGFRIPALSTRRTETEIELNNNQTFAIAGLMDNSMNSSMQKIPGIGHIPILGLLFQSKAAQKHQTELVVMITPEILNLDSPGVAQTLPRLQEPFMTPLSDRQSVAPPASRPAPARTPSAGPVTAAPAPTYTLPAEPTPTPAAAVPAAGQAVPVVPAATAPASDAPAPLQVRPGEIVPATATTPPSEDPADRSGDAMPAPADVAPITLPATSPAADDPQRVVSKAERDRIAKLAREQEKRDTEAAKRAVEQYLKQQALDAKQQKAIAEAEAKLKAAQMQYAAQIAKVQPQK